MTKIRAIFLVLIILLLATGLAYAGGHGARSAPQEVLIDPSLRSDVTGTVLITGANRGIGLELARSYADRGWDVIATARKPDQAQALNKLADQYGKIRVEQLDVLDQTQIDALAEKYADKPVDVLLNNAAILGAPEAQQFGNYDFDLFARIIDTNVAGPLRMAQAFAQQVAASDQKKIVAITSVQGSIQLIRGDSIQFYNASKTALNMSMRAIGNAVKDEGITVALISPGAVDTDMMATALAGSKFPMRLLTPTESAEAVVNIIAQYGVDMSGTFLSHQGTKIPW